MDQAPVAPLPSWRTRHAIWRSGPCHLAPLAGLARAAVTKNAAGLQQPPLLLPVAEEAAAAAEGAAAAVAAVAIESEAGVSYAELAGHLAAGRWEVADAETRRLLCELAGDAAARRQWVYFSEVPVIPAADLLTLDRLWRAASAGRFGYAVQRRLWRGPSRRRWRDFFAAVGWTHGPNDTYKKFPAEFTWDAAAPVGHLPLTNALRGTRLLEGIFEHPAFAAFDADEAMPLDDDDAAAVPAGNGSAAAAAGSPSSLPPSEPPSASEAGKPKGTSDLGIPDDMLEPDFTF
eukprot:SM000141S00907  [mRNA]  locus=s141:238499:239823:- [translate_table: standard]